jgi:phage-related protein
MDLFKLVAKLSLDDSSYKKGLSGALSTAKSMLGAVGKGMAVIGGVTATAVGAVGTGVVALTKQATAAYGEYEQLAGGIETLFGEAAPKMMEQASEAYKTAGMSMNEYMETSIQSAAALINSLEGDQAKAAELMDMSITDMSDNVNKMGTTMEAVQNAYRGFSRGNFTMLDNLALGFAGTKEGMQELLDKAKEISGITYNIESYADIVEAIHVVQQEMGITGTTAKEANSTITGSLNAVKGAWQNLITGLADENADIRKLMNNVVDSVFGQGGEGGFINNLLPRIEQALTGISDLVVTAADRLPNIAQRFLPELVNSFVDTISKIINGVSNDSNRFVDNLGSLFKTIVNSALKLVGVAVDALPIVANILATIITTLANGLIEAVPKLIPSIIQVMMDLIGVITDNAGLILEAAITIITTLANALAENVPMLIDSVVTILLTIVDTLLNNIETILVAAVQIVIGLAEGIAGAIPRLIPVILDVLMVIIKVLSQNINLIVDAALQIVLALIDGLLGNLDKISLAVFQIMWNIIAAFISMIPQIISAAVQIIEAFIFGLGEGLLKMLSGDYWNGVLNSFIHSFEDIDWDGIGFNIIDGIIQGFKRGWENLKNTADNMVSSLKDIFTNGFDIHSPSRVFERYGEMIDEGLAIGVSSGESTKAMQDVTSNLNSAFNPQIAGAGAGGGNWIFPIYIGEELIDTQVVTALDRANYRSGGR